MFSSRFMFISDQGRVCSSLDEPTDEDFAYAAVGMVTILSLADGRYYGIEQKWLPIPPGRLGTAEVDDETTRPFHAPESYFEAVPDDPPSPGGSCAR